MMELAAGICRIRTIRYASAQRITFVESPILFVPLECTLSLGPVEDLPPRQELQWGLWYVIDFSYAHRSSILLFYFYKKVSSASCNSDWLTIACASDNGRALQTGNTVCQDRLCGDVFSSVAGQAQTTVISNSRPFRVTVHFDGFEANVPTSVQNVQAQFNNRGFCLSYIQQPCTA